MILVTGGTGLVGIYLLMRLCKFSNLRIVAMYRSLDKLEKASVFFLKNNTLDEWESIEWVEGDITEAPSLERIFDAYKITQVYHCAAYVTFQSSAFNTLKKVNIEGTANMVNFSIDYNVEKFCYISSIATLHLKSGQNIIDETSSWNAEMDNSGYAISKFGGEMEVWRGAEEGLNVIIVHPGVIIGEVFREGGSTAIFENLKKGMPFYTDGKSGYITAFDVAKLLVKLMNSNINNDSFVLVSENLTHKEVCSTILKAYGKKSPNIKIPKIGVLLIAGIEYIFDYLFGYEPQIALEITSSLFSINSYSSQKIQKNLDFEFEKVLPIVKKTAERNRS